MFVEASPHPVLAMGIEEALADCGADAAVVVSSLSRGDGGLRRMLESARLEEFLAERDPRSARRESSGLAEELSAASDQKLIDCISDELGIS